MSGEAELGGTEAGKLCEMHCVQEYFQKKEKIFLCIEVLLRKLLLVLATRFNYT